MKNYAIKTYTRLEQVSRTCDMCGETEAGPMELMEWIHIQHHCGYASVFGDNQTYEIDICQKCIQKNLYPYMNLVERDS